MLVVILGRLKKDVLSQDHGKVENSGDAGLMQPRALRVSIQKLVSIPLDNHLTIRDNKTLAQVIDIQAIKEMKGDLQADI